IRDRNVTGVQTCALPILLNSTLVKASNGDRVAASQLLRQPDVRLSDLLAQQRLPRFEIEPHDASVDMASAETAVKYVGYLRRQRSEERRVGKEGGARVGG